MATANLSVGINTTKAKSDLQELKAWMAKGLTDMTLSINSAALQTSVNTAMKGPSGGYRLHINAAQLKTDVADALKGAVAGAKVGGGSIDSTQIAAGIKQIKQTLSTGLAEAGQEGGKRLTKTITDDFGNLVTVSHKAGVAAGKAAAAGMEEGAKTANISYRFKEGAGAVGSSLPTNYTAEQVKARAEQEKTDAASRSRMLNQVSMMKSIAELDRKNGVDRIATGERVADLERQHFVYKVSQSQRVAELERANAISKLAATQRQADLERAQLKAQTAAAFAQGKMLAPDNLTAKGKAKSGAEYAISQGFPQQLLPAGAAGLLQATDGLEKGIKKVGQAHTEATGKTKAHTAAMHDAHSAARGLASGMGMMWLTWGNIAPLLAGASLSHGFIQAMKAGTEFAYQLTFVKTLGGETADSVRGIGAAALEMSKNGLYGPVELANGLRVLSQAGISAKDSIMALPQVFDLATVGEMNMKDAAITLAGVMTAFNLQVKDMSHIGDVFSKAAAESQTSVEQMTQAMKTASVVGEQYGASMEDTATALTLLAKVNITGTAAGTSLRNMLKELYTPTEKAASIMKNLGLSAQTAAGELKPFPDVVYALKGKLEEFNKASQVKILQGMFGERGAKEAMAMLSQTREEWDKLNKTISESGGFMAKVSAELEATTKGSFKKAVNTLQSTLIEAFQNSEGAAGQLAIKLQQTFNSESFKTAVNGIVTGMLGLTNALVFMGPVLATVAAGWVTLRGVMIAGDIWSLTAGKVTLAKDALLAASAAMTTAGGGLAGLKAAMLTLMGPFGWFVTTLAAAAAGLVYLYNKMGDYGYANALANSTNTAASAMENLANKTRAATAELRRQRMEKEGKTEVGQSLSVVQKAESDLKDTKALLDSLTDAQRTGGISAQRGFMISALTTSLREQNQELTKLRKNYGEASSEFKEGLRERSKIATLESEEGIRGMPTTKLKPSQVAAKKTAEGTAAWLKQNTEFIIENYGEQAATILDRVTKNLNEQVQDAKIATGTRNADEVMGKGGGGRADREAAKLENSVIQDLEKRYQAELKTADAHYNKLEKIENAKAQHGITTKDEAEAKITALTEEHWAMRLEKVSAMSDEMSALLGKSVKLSEADAQKAKTFVATAQEEIKTLKEKIEWIKEEAKLKAEGAQIRFDKGLKESTDTIEKEIALRRQKVYGKADDPISRARAEGELLVELEFKKRLTDAEEAYSVAQKGTSEEAIANARRNRDVILESIAQQKAATADYFEEFELHRQSAEYGWNQFWTKYRENGLTAAKVVEQGLESVTSNLEKAFSDMFEKGTFDAKTMLKAIGSDLAKLIAKMAVADLGRIITGKGESSGDILSKVFVGMPKGDLGSGGMIGEDGAFGGSEGNILTKATDGLKNFWNSLTGATTATENAATKTAEGVLQTVTKTTTETSATSALASLTAAATEAAAALSMISSTGGGGGGGLGGLLGGLGKEAGGAGGYDYAAFDTLISGFAKGGAFNSGAKAFAKGGTFTNQFVNSPTLFKFADGTGIMGEAGPEAIMPLTRDGQGRLGVRYEGRDAPKPRSDMKVTTNNINVNVHSPKGDSAEIRRAGASVARSIGAAMAGSRRYA